MGLYIIQVDMAYYSPEVSFVETDQFEAPYFKHIIEPHASAEGMTATDVRHVQKFRDIDVDFVLEKPSCTKYIEAKFDHEAARSGYLFFETASSIRANTPGCILKSQADRMHYVTPLLGKVFSFDLKAFSRYWFFHTAGDRHPDPLSVRPDAYPPEGPRGWDVNGKEVFNNGYMSWGYRCTIEAVGHPTHGQHYGWTEEDLPDSYLEAVAEDAVNYFVHRRKSNIAREEAVALATPRVLKWLD